MNLQPFRNPKYSINELLDVIKDFGSKLQQVRDKIGKPDTDERHTALYSMQCAFMGLGLPLYAMTGIGLKSRIRSQNEVEESMTGYASISGKTHDEVMTEAERIWRLGLLVQFHFSLDFLFQSLLKRLSLPTAMSFWKNKDTLLNAVTLRDRHQADQVLEMLTNIRNSLHNGGRHGQGNVAAFVIDGFTYELKKGHTCECSSFGHIFALMSVVIDVVDEILQNPTVSALP